MRVVFRRGVLAQTAIWRSGSPISGAGFGVPGLSDAFAMAPALRMKLAKNLLVPLGGQIDYFVARRQLGDVWLEVGGVRPVCLLSRCSAGSVRSAGREMG